jgi:L-rhamnose isomerase / sugar isomerase
MPRGPIDPTVIERDNDARAVELREDLDHLGTKLARRGVDLDGIVERVRSLGVAIPTWGVGSGGTRFGLFPIAGEPRNIFEKIEDCAVIHQLSAATPRLSPHFPWDRTGSRIEADSARLRRRGGSRSTR